MAELFGPTGEIRPRTMPALADMGDWFEPQRVLGLEVADPTDGWAAAALDEAGATLHLELDLEPLQMPSACQWPPKCTRPGPPIARRRSLAGPGGRWTGHAQPSSRHRRRAGVAEPKVDAADDGRWRRGGGADAVAARAARLAPHRDAAEGRGGGAPPAPVEGPRWGWRSLRRLGRRIAARGGGGAIQFRLRVSRRGDRLA